MLKDVKQNRNVTNVTSTPYDDVFRTLVNDCRRRLVIPLVNEIFKESYSGKEEISPAPNEHFMNRQDGKEAERITDSSFTIYGKTPKKYHIECQSRPDGSMLVRMFEYDTQIAVDDAQVEKYHEGNLPSVSSFVFTA